MSNDTLSKAIELIRIEREQQDAKWGGAQHDDAHGDGDWLHIFNAKFGEFSGAVMRDDGLEATHALVQSIAVLVAWLEHGLRAQDFEEVMSHICWVGSRGAR